MVLEFALPDLDRSCVINWDSKGAKQARIDSHSFFDSDPESVDPSSDSSDEDNPVTEERKYTLDVEDEFLLVLMKLRFIC